MLTLLRTFIHWLLEPCPYTWEDEMYYVAIIANSANTPVEVLPDDERADPLGLYTNAEAPRSEDTQILWRCPHCGLPVGENAFQQHVESHAQNVWGEFINTLNFDADWPFDGKPEDQELNF